MLQRMNVGKLCRSVALFWLCGGPSAGGLGLVAVLVESALRGCVCVLIMAPMCCIDVILFGCALSVHRVIFIGCIMRVYGSFARVIAASRAFIWCIVRVFSYGAPRAYAVTRQRMRSPVIQSLQVDRCRR